MIKVTTETIVKGKSPSQIYNWIIHLTPEQFRQWHPKNHLYYEAPIPLKTGDTIWLKERLPGFGRLKVNNKWEIIRLESPSSILMKMKSYPDYMELTFLPLNGDTKVIFEVRVTFIFKRLEKIFDWFVNKFILTPKRINSIKQHIVEEYKNLDHIL
jgi:hypothetical protein